MPVHPCISRLSRSSPTYTSLHEPRYSVIANPYTLGRQNCTAFVLGFVNAAIYSTSDIRLIKANTQTYFNTQPINVNPFKLMLSSMFSADISISDHNGKAVTATFEKIAEYLGTYDRETKVISIHP